MNTSTKRRVIYLVILLVYVAEGLGYYYLARDGWQPILRFWFQLLAVYGIGLGIVAKMEGLRDFGELLEDMSSGHVLEFLSGNLRFLGIFFSIVSLGLHSDQDAQGRGRLGCLGQMLLLLLAIPIFLYSIFHIFILLPVAYIAYVLASAVVVAIARAGSDIDLKLITKEGQEKQKVSLKGVIQDNQVTAKGFMVGLPPVAVALLTQAAGLLR